MLPSTVPAQGESPALPATWTWHLRISAPLLKALMQVTFPSAEAAHSSSLVQGSPGWTVPALANTLLHEGMDAWPSQKSEEAAAVCTSARQSLAAAAL